MPTYACSTCRTKFFAHDSRGRVCAKCAKLMPILKPGQQALGYAVVSDTKKPYMAFGPKYSGQAVVALIDGPKPKYKGQAISTLNQRDYLNDDQVPEAEKKEYTRQQGERDSAEDLHDKIRGSLPDLIKVLEYVEDYEPNTSGQKDKIRNTFSSLRNLGGDIRLYLVAHHDPESKRFSGLAASDLAGLVAAYPFAKAIKRIILVGCHTAGEAKSAQEADAVLNADSFAAQFHQCIGASFSVYTEVSAYVSLVQLRFGHKRERFGEQDVPIAKLAKSKVLFVWNEGQMQARSFVYQ